MSVLESKNHEKLIKRDLRRCWSVVCEQTLVREKDATACWFGKTLAAEYKERRPTSKMPRVYGIGMVVALANAIRKGTKGAINADAYGDVFDRLLCTKEPRRLRTRRAFVKDLVRNNPQLPPEPKPTHEYTIEIWDTRE